MLVEVSRDIIGDVVLTPVSERVKEQMRVHNLECHGHADDTVHLQEWRGDEFVETMSPANQAHVNRGYTATIRMDTFRFGLMVGYDFENVINP